MRKFFLMLAFCTILISFASFSLFIYNSNINPGHNGNEIIVNIDGVTKTLQDSIISGDLFSSTGSPNSLLSSGKHYGIEILIKIGGVEKNLQQAINEGLYICRQTNTNPWSGTFNGDIDPGHTADKILIDFNGEEMSLQTAISRNIICTTPPSWKFDDWSTCSVTCGGGVKSRNVWCERNDGAVVSNVDCVNTIPVSSESCNTQACPINCVGSWSDTSICSATCGGGVKQQIYTISVPAQNGGSACLYSNGATRWGSSSCNTQACCSSTITQNGLTYKSILANDGKCWLDRNLGAGRVATAYNDDQSYGWLYQWGRGTDGHQIRTSTTTTVLSTSNNPAHNKFIVAPILPRDWKNPQNNDLWQGGNGINNPCPSGFRLPTTSEWVNLVSSESIINVNTAFASSLKLSSGGYRNRDAGTIYSAGLVGFYWSSTPKLNIPTEISSHYFMYYSGAAYPSNSNFRATGASVRCIKN